jgi:hypothetical protein
MSGSLRALALLACGLVGGGCNSALPHGIATAFRATPGEGPWSYAPRADVAEPVAGETEALLVRFAPAFVIEEGEAEWNRIGTPTLHRRAGIERARVDPRRAALYAEARSERIGAREVWQLVYRIHFDQLAPTWKYVASLHRNAGLLVLVTVDRASAEALAVSTVHTCGCWLAVVPTDALAPDALPRDWPAGRQEVHDESLPARIGVPVSTGGADERFVVHLASRSHRVRDVVLARPGADARVLPLVPMDALRSLPVDGVPGATGSFFHEAGFLRGHVKGAWAPLEGLTLGLLTLDPRLGMDRDFGDPEVTGARFSTALVPWRREETRLDRFGRALEELGFRTAAFAPAAPAAGPAGGG